MRPVFRVKNTGRTLGCVSIQTQIVTLLLLVTGPFMYGQTPNIVPVSPEASALAKMVNYPVSLNTGLPDISIPLYKIESGGMTLPVALNYHPGGFKINERSTSVGLGWSLSCDLQITRTINGLDDIAGSTSGGTGYIANSKMAGGAYPLYDGSSSAYDIAAGLVDGMPDKFNYKLLNKSGSFYFQKNSSGSGYTIVPVPYDNIKITYDSTNDGFIIIDTDGTQYTFGGSTAKEYTGYSTDSNVDNTTAWKCTQVANATNTDVISFAYQSKSTLKNFNGQDRIEYYNNDNPFALGGYNLNTMYMRSGQISSLYPNVNTYEGLIAIYPFYRLSSPRYTEYFGYKHQALFHLPDLNDQNQVVDKTFTVTSASSGSVSYSFGLTLSSISFRGGSVVFSGADQLNSISVQDANGSEIRSFSFIQSNALPANLNGAKTVNGDSFNGTYYLDAIQVKSNGTVFEQYGLQYQDKYCFGNHLSGKDAWGYPNDYTTDNSAAYDPANYCNTCDPGVWQNGAPITVPHQQIIQRFQKDIFGGGGDYVDNVAFNIGNSANTEIPSHYGAQHGILQRIIYPTGGHVDFDFESNMYKEGTTDTEVQAVRMGGGLRIRSINYYDGKSSLPVTQKYYRYGELEDGIGLLINAPDRNYNETGYEYDPYSYSQTISYLSGPGSIDAGKDFEPIPINCSNRDCMTLDFSEKKTTYLPASSISNTYSTGAPIYYTKVTEYNSDLGINTGKKEHIFYDPNYFNPYSFGPQSKVPGTNIDVLQTDGLMGQEHILNEYKYANGQYSLIHNKQFNYTKYNRPDQVQVVYSCFNVIYQVLGGNYQGQPGDLYHGSDQTNSYQVSDYNAGQYGIQVGKLLLSSETETWYNSNTSQVPPQITQYAYDGNGHMQPMSIVTTNAKGQQVTKTIKYAYDFADPVSTQMVANNMISQPIEETVYNTTLGKEISKTTTNYGSVTSHGSTTSEVTFIAPVNALKSVGGNAAETLLTYDLYDRYADILQITGKDKLPVSYLWGYNHKYLIAEVKGVPYTVAASASTLSVDALLSLTDDSQIKTNLNTLRANLTGAFVNSFTHKPLIGLSSQTNPAGKSSYYEYDPFGRLKVIRDQNNYIVKEYDYRELNSSNNYSSTNIPMMETFYGTLYDGSAASLSTNKIYNTIAPGGTYLGSYVDQANNFAKGSGSPDYSGASIASTGDAIMSLFRWCQPTSPIPGAVHFDLIKNGAVVFSKPFSTADVSPPVEVKFHVPPGSYTISFRNEDNFSGSAVKYHLVKSDGSGSYVKSGDTVNLLSGTTYALTMSNEW